MTLKQLKSKLLFKILTNTYVIILSGFVIWILFFDENTYLNRKLGNEIEELESSIEFYEKKNQENKNIIKSLQDSLKLEKYAREKYLMKKKNEDIYIIEFDTIKK